MIEYMLYFKYSDVMGAPEDVEQLDFMKFSGQRNRDYVEDLESEKAARTPSTGNSSDSVLTKRYSQSVYDDDDDDDDDEQSNNDRSIQESI